MWEYLFEIVAAVMVVWITFIVSMASQRSVRVTDHLLYGATRGGAVVEGGSPLELPSCCAHALTLMPAHVPASARS